LVIARVRGARDYRREEAPEPDGAEAQGPLPDVTEAPPRRINVPEVVDSTHAQAATPETVNRAIPPTSRVDMARKENAQPEPLEDERIVDLLNDDE
jgi:hypothetical protein